MTLTKVFQVIVWDNWGGAVEAVLASRQPYAVMLPRGDKLGPEYLNQAEELLGHVADVVVPSTIAFGNNPGFHPPYNIGPSSLISSICPASAFRVSLLREMDKLPEKPSELWAQCYDLGARFFPLRGLHYFKRT